MITAPGSSRNVLNGFVWVFCDEKPGGMVSRKAPQKEIT